MLRIFVTLIGFLFIALRLVSAGAEELCPVEGITARWVMSYCMTRFETDDDAHPGVSSCYLTELHLANDPEQDCEANLAYKSAICSLLIEWEIYEDTLASCVASEEVVPSVVKNGIG